MRDIVLDTQVLVNASREELCAQLELLEGIETSRDVKLAIDQQGTILQEYNDKMTDDRFGQKWLAKMLSDDRVEKYRKLSIPKRQRIALLDKHHFDPNDLRFVETAIVTKCKRLVAEEDDYTVAVRALLKKKPLRVVVNTSPEAMAWIDADPSSR